MICCLSKGSRNFFLLCDTVTENAEKSGYTIHKERDTMSLERKEVGLCQY